MLLSRTGPSQRKRPCEMQAISPSSSRCFAGRRAMPWTGPPRILTYSFDGGIYMSISGYCPCKDEQCGKDVFEVTDLGVYRTDGMTSRLEVWRCLECDR